jgi:hypothetical protein
MKLLKAETQNTRQNCNKKEPSNNNNNKRQLELTSTYRLCPHRRVNGVTFTFTHLKGMLSETRTFQE